MIHRCALLAALLLLAPVAHGESAVASFSVEIRLTVPGSAPAAGCTSSSTASAPGGDSVQVRCTDGVFVDIFRVAGVRQGRLITGVQLAVDGVLPDYCRDERLGYSRNAVADALCGRPGALNALSEQADEDSGGWLLAEQLYADPAELHKRHAALVRWRDGEGTVTSLHVSSADRQVPTVELLVSF